MLDFSFACERPSGGTATVTISEVRATSLVAPAATYLRANAISGFTLSTAPSGTDYEPEFHEITYIWNVRGSPLSLELPSVLNMPTVWKDPNVAYGPEVLFAFDAAGTYDIDLFAIDRSGNYGTTTIQRVVTLANDAFPTTKTICYSETDFTGKPTGAQEVGTTTALNSAIAASTGDIRVMFRGGQTFVTDRIVCTAADSIAFTSFGTGGRATVTLLRQLYDDETDNLFEPTPGTEIKFYDLNMAGPWDAVRERGVVAGSPVWLNRAPDTLYHRVKITGSTQVYIGFPTNAAIFGCNEVEITGWQNFAVFGHADGGSGNKYVGFKACSFHQHSDAAGGFTPGDKSLQNAHGPIRLEETKHLYMGLCDFFSKNGWSSAYGETQDQPCLRLNSNGVAGVHTTVDRIACENGGIIVALNEQDRTFSVSGNHVFDRMLTVSGNETSYAMTIDYAGTTLRNCLHIEPNITKTQNGVTDAIYAFMVKSGTAAAQKDSPCAIHNCSVFSPITSANNKDANGAALTNMVLAVNGYGADDAMTNFTDENNVLHAPNQDTPFTTYAPLDLATAIPGFTPRYTGKRNSLPSYTHNLAGNVTSPSGSFTLAYSNFKDRDGVSTDQAYWQGLDAGDIEHAISVGLVGKLYSEEGDFTVGFEASVIRITNTSGVTWTSGQNVLIKLDHSSLRPLLDAAYSLTGITMPLMRPLSGSAAIGAGDTGLKAYDDFLLGVRPASGAEKGALEYIAAAPQFASASVNAAGTEVDVVISGGPISGTWVTTGFTVRTNGHRLSLASASEVSDTITLVVDDGGPIIDSETVTVSYDGTGNWANGGTPVDTFTNQAVTNNSAVSADTTFSTNVTLTNQDYTGTSGVDAIVDSYAGTWQSSYEASGTDYQYPIQFRDRGTAKTTVIGVKSYGHASLTLDWEYTYNTQTPRDNTNNIGAKDNHDLTIFRACYVDFGWDAFRVNSSSGNDTFIIEGAYVNIDRDDFLEADDNCSGTIRDCLFDGGFAGISFTDDINSPVGKQIDCVGVLSRLTPYLYNTATTHFGPAVKLSTTSMDWSANDCIFAIEKPDHRTDYVQRGWDHLTGGGTGNFLLNLSDTALAGGYPTPPAGWTVLQGATARAKWETEKAAWLAAHGYGYLVSAATDANGDQVTLTFSENVTGTEDTTDWSLYGVTGAPVAPTTVTISTNTVVLDFSASTIANGDTVELSYYGGDVADGDGIQIGYVTKYAVTNNVP